MNVKRSKVIVIEESEHKRSMMCTWLSHEGYAVFECKDTYKALRLIRKIVPNLVIITTETRNINMQQFLDIIENDQQSHVLLISHRDNHKFKRLQLYTSTQLYCILPLEKHLFLKNVVKALKQFEDQKNQKLFEKRIKEQDERVLIIEQAKKIIIRKWQLSEEHAHSYIRKKSMDLSISMQVLAQKIINSEHND